MGYKYATLFTINEAPQTCQFIYYLLEFLLCIVTLMIVFIPDIQRLFRALYYNILDSFYIKMSAKNCTYSSHVIVFYASK